MDMREKIEQFLISEIAIDADVEVQSLSLDEDLIAAGLIDSLGILKLVAFVEKNFGVKLKEDDIVPDNFRTLNCLEKLIKNKQVSR